MKCPRCGFEQPPDQFCANCGVDVQQFVVKPKPIWVRFFQNPNLHLGMIAALILVVLGYIFYTQADLLGSEMGSLFKGLPLLSRDASEPTEAAPEAEEAEPQEEKPDLATEAAAKMEATAPEVLGKKAEAADGKELELSFWEVPKEVLVPLLNSAEKNSGGAEGKILLWNNKGKILEALEESGQRIEGGRMFSLSQSPIVVEDGMEGQDSPLLFDLNLTVSKAPTGEYAIKWNTVLRIPAEGSRFLESAIDSNATLPEKGLMMVVVDPSDRKISMELLNRAAAGPLGVFTSDEYRQGLTDWVIVLIQR